VFLHGNPTSSYLWRRVIAEIKAPGRYLAPDLIGMGDSGNPPIPYRFADHARYLAAWFDALALQDVILVGHDWGGALAFDWASRQPQRTRALAFMETIVRSMTWGDVPEAARPLFRSLRTPGVGESMVLEQNVFIEQALPATVATGLSDADLAVYRKPYPTRDSRRRPSTLPCERRPATITSHTTRDDLPPPGRAQHSRPRRFQQCCWQGNGNE
jgi:haloalkane dehalogenase